MKLILSFLICYSTLQASEADSLKLKLLKHEITAEIKQELDTEINELKANVKETVELAKENMGVEAKKYGVSLILVNFIIFGAGISLILVVRKNAQKKLTKLIDNALYKVDPTYLPIKIPSVKMKFEYDRLKALKFRNIKTYQTFDDNCLTGAVVVFCENDDDARIAQKFILDKNLKDTIEVVFIIYKKGPRVEPAIFSDFANVTYANTPLTLIQALFVAGRGMII